MATPNRQSDYISEVRAAVKQLWLAYETLRSKQDEWNAQDYLNTLAPGVGENEGITAGLVGACVFDTPNAIATLFAAGHATNLTNLL